MINNLVLFPELFPFHCELSPTAWTSHRKRHGVECSAWLDLHELNWVHCQLVLCIVTLLGGRLWVAPNDPPKGPTSNFVFEKLMPRPEPAKLAWGILRHWHYKVVQECIAFRAFSIPGRARRSLRQVISEICGYVHQLTICGRFLSPKHLKKKTVRCMRLPIHCAISQARIPPVYQFDLNFKAPTVRDLFRVALNDIQWPFSHVFFSQRDCFCHEIIRCGPQG